MMKRILGILLSMGFVFSLVACGSSAGSKDVESEGIKEAVESTVEEKEEAVESPEVATEETKIVESVEAEKEEPAYIPHPRSNWSSFLVEGYWYFAADSSENGDQKWYIYDVDAEEIVGESKMNLDSCQYYFHYEGDFISGNMAIVGDGEKRKLVDVTTEQVIVELGENQYFITDWNDGMVLVAESQATLEQTTVALGVLNDKGEWITPLTTIEGEAGTELYSECGGFSNNSYIGEGKYLFRNPIQDYGYVYNGMSGKVIPFTDNWKTQGACLGIEGNKVCWFDALDYVTYSIDMETGEIAKLYQGEMNCVKGDTELYYNKNYDRDKNKIYIMDISGTVSEYDFSSYSQVDFAGVASTSRMVVSLWNEQNSRFLCLVNADGSMEFEPIEVSKVPSTMTSSSSGDHMTLTEEKLVGWSGQQVFIYNTSTKELVNTEVPYRVRTYDPDIDKFVVEGEHPEYGLGQYLVDTDDLQTLINPFE